MTISDVFSRPPTPRETTLADRLRADLARLASKAADQMPFWKETCDELTRFATEQDPRFFKRWPLLVATMVYRTTPETVRMYRALRRSPAWRTGLADAMTGERYGNGAPFLANPRVDNGALHYATHLEHFRTAAGRSILDHDCILELGGGYGGMCAFARRLGFRGRYVIFDLPPVLALQRYYLGLHGIEAEYAAEAPNVLCHNLEDVAAFLRPNAALLSTWALSEMPLSLREQIEGLLHDDRPRSALLAYSRSWSDIDNYTYFEELQERHAALWDWRRSSIDDDRFYLVGLRR